MVDVLFKGKLVKDIQLVPIRTGPNGPTHLLEREAAGAFSDMDAAAKAAGITLKVNSSFRSIEKQMQLYQQYVVDLAAHQANTALKKPSIVGMPGNSYHEVGKAVDIDTAGQGRASAVYKWLDAHAGDFGFKNTVASEPWHWQYIGVSAAKKAMAALFNDDDGDAGSPGDADEKSMFLPLLAVGALAAWWWYHRK